MTAVDLAATTRVGAASERWPATTSPAIQGLSALAIGLVLVHHAGVRQLPGGFVGVDVLFVTAGFLVTGALLREVEHGRRVQLQRFYRQHAARLLPGLGLLLLTATALAWWLATDTELRVFGGDILSAALSVVNWRLADRSVDPFVLDGGASPVQHLWAVAVGGQFLLLWPLLLLSVAWWLGMRRHARPRPVLALAVALIAVLSFVWSMFLSPHDPSAAFFSTTTRLWELGIGALVAVGTTAWRGIPRAVATGLGWVGLGAVIGSALVLSTAVPWSGRGALLPTMGAAAVIIATHAAGGHGAARVLAWRPAVWVGGLSYSLYLWHWPLLVAAMSVWGELGARRGLLVVAASLVPAYLSHRLVDHSTRTRRGSRHSRPSPTAGVSVTVAAAVAGLVLAVAVVPTLDKIVSPLTGAGAAVLAHAGAGTITGGDGTVESLDEVEWFVPSTINARLDRPSAYADGCQVGADSAEPVRCEYGDLDSDVVIAVVGDSKVLQWQSTLELIAVAQGWRVVSYTKSSCGFHAAVQMRLDAAYTTCTEWNVAVRTALAELEPDVVITSQGEPYALADPDHPSSTSVAAMVDGLVASWSALLEQGSEVIVIADTLGPDTHLFECVAANPGQLEACTFDRAQGVAGSAGPTQLAAAERVPEVEIIDLTDRICPLSECVPVIGNVLVWREGTHITDTYARSLVPALSEQLVPLVEGTG